MRRFHARISKNTFKNIITAINFLAVMSMTAIAGASGGDVTVQTGMSCPGWTGSGTSEHIAGSFGGVPDPGYSSSPLDQYKVKTSVHHHSCIWSGGSNGYWICDWQKLYEDETNWTVGVNSYVTNYEVFIDQGFIKQHTDAGTWGLGYYWSAEQDSWWSTYWEYASDYCGI